MILVVGGFVFCFVGLRCVSCETYWRSSGCDSAKVHDGFLLTMPKTNRKVRGKKLGMNLDSIFLNYVFVQIHISMFLFCFLRKKVPFIAHFFFSHSQ
ncbi:hypothetical protein IC582_000328 [Cucumis melo]